MDATYLVGVTRWNAALGPELGPLGALLGLAPYDLRQRLAGPLPVVVARHADAELTRKIMEVAQSKGHGVVCALEHQLLSSSWLPRPRDFVLEQDAMVFSGPGMETRSIAWCEVRAILHAMGTSEMEHNQEQTTKKFSVGRAVMTGGLSTRKTVQSAQQSVSSDFEQVLYLVSTDFPSSLLLGEKRLHYGGLGQLIGRTTPENFKVLIQVLRERAPHAFFDDRLVSQRRKARGIVSAGTAKDHTTVQSNASENDVAAHLILAGHIQEQARPAS